jgi:hypothetical protein
MLSINVVAIAAVFHAGLLVSGETLHIPQADASTRGEEQSQAIAEPRPLLTPAQKLKSGGPNKGGQVLEIGAYHLEFVPEQADQGTHLDLYLQNGSDHKPIPNAKVTAQIQMPDGTKKSTPLTYDAKGKHYTALLASKASGLYKIVFLCDIGGKKVNGRFSFKR